MKRIIKAYDYPTFIAVVLLCLFGLVMIYSSSMITAVTRYDQSPDFFFDKQRTYLIISFIAMLMAMVFPYKAYQNKKFLMFMMFGIAGFLFLVNSIGHTAGGAQSWFKVGSSSIQPGEFAKLALIIYLAAIYGKRQNLINNMDKAIMPPIIFLVFICFLIAIQPDYGTAAIIFLISGAIIISSGMSFKSLFKLGLLTMGVALIFGLGFFVTGNFSSLLSENKISRFTGFMDPFGTADKDGYQLVNSLFAIGSGGLTGVGLGDSVQKYGYLPESHTDFIMAVIAEELGIFGVAFVLLALGFIVLRGFLLSAKCKDPFGSLLLIGISSMIGIQVFINVGGVTGLIPITGITLPFISYGGSSLLVLMISMGIYQNIIMRMNLLADKENPITDSAFTEQTATPR
ncbi:FtsW/RodA/SpoVE family cell cycle protein [Bacillus massiliglaciei]|uniref:FtsW/RodA/SpoVE family cell cycle protein n=1 Tax=Bacillus massiliglaciei TaxID=1816693 RepID=UPI000A9C7E6A|nr:FtsW/RodA/SpoVE family cell cycle protein [Bacillus massiliglaciei]